MSSKPPPPWRACVPPPPSSTGLRQHAADPKGNTAALATLLLPPHLPPPPVPLSAPAGYSEPLATFSSPRRGSSSQLKSSKVVGGQSTGRREMSGGSKTPGQIDRPASAYSQLDKGESKGSQIVRGSSSGRSPPGGIKDANPKVSKTANKENKQSKPPAGGGNRLASTSALQRPLSSPGAFAPHPSSFLADKSGSSTGAI
jgi:hypothetical protein